MLEVVSVNHIFQGKIVALSGDHKNESCSIHKIPLSLCLESAIFFEMGMPNQNGKIGGDTNSLGIEHYHELVKLIGADNHD